MHPVADRDEPPRAVLIAALAVAVAAVGAVLAVAVIRQQPPDRAVPVAAVPAPHATDPACRALLAALPPRLGDFPRADIAAPAPDGAAAWRAGGEPVVLRCGLDRPVGFVVGSAIQLVNQVQWFDVRDTDGRSSWYTVDRPVYVALTLPPGSGPTAIQELSELIARTLPATPIDPAPPA